MKTWQNTEHTYMLWRYANVQQWMEELRVTGLIHLAPALQSDLLRLFIMQRYGGLYVDCDCERIGSIPTTMPLGSVGHWYDGADPFMIYAEPNNPHIEFMIEYGYKQPYHAEEIYRWGFKSYNNFWPGNTLHVQGWCRHISQHSWGSSHQSKPVNVPPTKLTRSIKCLA